MSYFNLTVKISFNYALTFIDHWFKIIKVKESQSLM